MTQPPDDWSDLTQTWTDPASDEPATARADAAFIRSLHRRDRLARLNFAGEILGGLVVTGVIIWAAIKTGLPWPVTVTAFTFIVAGMALTLWSRRGDPGVMTETPQAVLLSAIAQARTGERWGLAGIGTSLSALVFLGVIAWTVPSKKEELLGFYPAFIAFLAICIVAYGTHAMRCRKRRRAHEVALKALADD